MKFLITHLITLLSFSLFAQVPKEEYNLIGMDDNQDWSISIYQIIEKDIVHFVTKKDTVSVFDVRDIDTLINHFDRFLEIKFRIRGGSNIKRRETVLLCVSGGTLFKSLQLSSEESFRVDQVYDKVTDNLKLFDEAGLYQVNVSIEERNGNFIATLIESNYVRSKFDPSQNESFKETYQLNFDKNGYYFFNSTKTLNGRYIVYSHQENEYFHKVLSSEAAAVKLIRGSYFFIDGVWYVEGRDNILLYR